MKKCNRFHIEDVEYGDVLFLETDRETGEFEEPFPKGRVVVQHMVRTGNFGWIIVGRDGIDYYLNDYDNVYQVTS